ncbi:MAG: SDR family NAD(P)-dependent oxidoreductase, partial [Pelagibacteraceae bacterium]
MNNLKNKKIILTGGSRGIGLSILKEFYDNGSEILTIGSNLQNLENLKKDFPNIQIEQLNLKNHDELNKKFPEFIEKMGGLDILINNAGITQDNLTLRMKETEWKDVID